MLYYYYSCLSLDPTILTRFNFSAGGYDLKMLLQINNSGSHLIWFPV